MSMMVSFVLSFFPRDVLDEILNLIESVSEDLPSYSCHSLSKNYISNGPTSSAPSQPCICLFCIRTTCGRGILKLWPNNCFISRSLVIP